MPNTNQNKNFPLTVLIILDGWGVAPPADNNLIDKANTPFFDYLNENYPVTTLLTNNIKPLTPENIYKKIGSLEKKSLGYYLSKKDLIQCRLGESENIALLTDFFDRGDLVIGSNYNIKIISTPLINDFNSFNTCTSKLSSETVKIIKKNQVDFIAINFASVEKLITNDDTGLAIKGIEAIDKNLKIITENVLNQKGTVFLLGAFGRLEQAFDITTNELNKNITDNQVPLIVISEKHLGININWSEFGTDTIDNFSKIFLSLLEV